MEQPDRGTALLPLLPPQTPHPQRRVRPPLSLFSSGIRGSNSRRHLMTPVYTPTTFTCDQCTHHVVIEHFLK